MSYIRGGEVPEGADQYPKGAIGKKPDHKTRATTAMGGGVRLVSTVDTMSKNATKKGGARHKGRKEIQTDQVIARKSIKKDEKRGRKIFREEERRGTK